MDVEVSPEYLPDVYEINKDAPGQIHILNAFQKDVEPKSLNDLMETLETLGHKIPKENIKKINSFIEVQKAAANIIENKGNSSFVITIILGEMYGNKFKFKDCKDDIEINDLMRCFLESGVKGIKDTPKILIFQGKLEIKKDTVVTDAAEIDLKVAYGLPAEADMLIALRKEGDFLGSLSNNLRKYGGFKDLMSIMTLSNRDENPLLFISTFTRKLFLNINFSGDKEHTMKQYENFKNNLKRLEEALEKRNVRQGSRSSLLSLSRKSSFNEKTKSSRTTIRRTPSKISKVEENELLVTKKTEKKQRNHSLSENEPKSPRQKRPSVPNVKPEKPVWKY